MRIEGLDPATGDLLRVTCEGPVITRVDRSPGAGADLPYLTPGLVDLQVNGYGGTDVNGPDVSSEGIVRITRSLARVGVTTWVPTVVTASEEQIVRSLRAVAAARREDAATAGAVPFVHVEGPFLSDQDGPRGVHDRAQIRPVDAAEVARWAEAGPLGYVTVSPHWEDSPAQIARIVASGVAVAIGHTHASVEQIRAAVDAGASLSTHLGNGIFATLPRHPNPIWTQLADDRLTCGLIADGHHLPAETLEVMIRAKGRGRAFLVSDSVELAGSRPGTYRTAVGGEVELSPDGRLSYVGTDLLAGAAVDLGHCVRFVLAHTSLSLPQVLEMATVTPGRVVAELGGARRGTVQVGRRADLLRLTAAGEVLDVVQGGTPVR